MSSTAEKSATKSSTRRGGVKKKKNNDKHTCPFDLKAITEAQTQTAASLCRFQDIVNAEIKPFEDRGLNIGYKLRNEDFTWLGAGQLASQECMITMMSTPTPCTTINNASLFPTFQSLLRPGVLPGKCRIFLNDKKLQAWVQKIWDGEMVYYVYPGSSAKAAGATVSLYATTTDDETLMNAHCYPSEHEKSTEIVIHGALRDVLDFTDQERLITRLMHHFLRQYAYMIPPYNVYEMLEGQLAVPLASKKCKEEYMDWQILRADVALNLPLPVVIFNDGEDKEDEATKYIFSRLQDVSCGLASLGRWEEVAPLLLELGDTFKELTKGIYEGAAGAFQNAGNNEKALEMYLKHLCKLGPWENVNEGPQVEVLGNMLFVHHALFEAATLQHNRNERFMQNHGHISIGIGFVALLRAANFTAMDALSFDFEEYMGGISRAVAKSLLKDKYKQRKHAKQALSELVMKSGGSIDVYTKSLLEILRPNTALPLRLSLSTQKSDDMKRFMAEEARKSAQSLAKENTLPARSCAHCGKWNFLDANINKCQCGKLYYCDGTCERDDWKKHKQTCTWYQKNKQRKCSACGKVGGGMMGCPCHEEYYCCKPCQVSEWKEHKKVCAWKLGKK